MKTVVSFWYCDLGLDKNVLIQNSVDERKKSMIINKTGPELTGTSPETWNLDFVLLLWTEYESGLPTGNWTLNWTTHYHKDS